MIDENKLPCLWFYCVRVFIPLKLYNDYLLLLQYARDNQLNKQPVVRIFQFIKI